MKNNKNDYKYNQLNSIISIIIKIYKDFMNTQKLFMETCVNNITQFYFNLLYYFG